MPTITIPRTDIASEQVSAALRNGLDDRYDVLPGMRITRIRTGSPHAPSQTTTARTTLASGQRFWVRTNCITLTCRFPAFRKRICALQRSATFVGLGLASGR